MQRHETKCNGPHNLIILSASILLGVLLSGCGNKGNELDAPDDRQSTTSPHPWPMAGANPQRNSLVQVEGTTTGRLLWTVPLGSAQPVLARMDKAGNSYHLAGQRLVCLGPDGKLRWNVELQSQRPYGLSVNPAGYTLLQSRDDDNPSNFNLISPGGELIAQPDIAEVVGTNSGSGFYVILADQQTAALLDNTGSLLNQHQFPAEISAAPGSRDRRLLPGIAVVRDSYNNDHFFSLDDGASWTTETDIPSEWNMDANGNLFGLEFRGPSTVLFRRDPDEDKVLGEYDGNFHRDPVITADDGLLIVNTDGILLKLAADGEILAERDTNMGFSSLIEYNGRVLARGGDKTDGRAVLRCFGDEFLRLEWQHESGRGSYGFEISPTDDPLIVISSGDSCRGFDIDGNLKWQHVYDNADWLMVDKDDSIFAMGRSTASVFNPNGSMVQNMEFPADVNLAGNEPGLTADRRIAFYWNSEPGLHILEGDNLSLNSDTDLNFSLLRGPALPIGNELLVFDDQSTMHLLASNGREKSSYTFSEHYPGDPLLHPDGSFVFVNIDGVRKFSLTDGLQFHLDQALENFALAIIAPSGDILVRTGMDTFQLLSATGEMKWQFTVDGMLSGEMSVGPDGNYYLARRNRLEAPDSAENNDQPQGNTGGNPAPERVPAQQNPDNDDELLALNGKGQKRWSLPLESTLRHSPIVDSKGRLYYIDNGKAVCLNGKDGSTVWTTEIPGLSSPGSIRSVAMDSQGRFLVSSWFKLYCIGD